MNSKGHIAPPEVLLGKTFKPDSILLFPSQAVYSVIRAGFLESSQ